MYFEAKVSIELLGGEREISLDNALTRMKNDVENAVQKFSHMVFLLNYKALEAKSREFVRRSLHHNEVVEETHTMVSPRGAVSLGFRLQCSDLSQVSGLLGKALQIMFPDYRVLMQDLSACHVTEDIGNGWATLWREGDAYHAVCPIRRNKAEQMPHFCMVAQA